MLICFPAALDVQEIEVSAELGNINVTCMFGQGSTAKGCKVFVISFTNGSSSPDPKDANRMEENGQLSTTSSTTFIGLQNDIYLVYIIDIESDGSFNIHIESHRQLIVIDGAPSPTPNSEYTFSYHLQNYSEVTSCLIVSTVGSSESNISELLGKFREGDEHMMEFVSIIYACLFVCFAVGAAVGIVTLALITVITVVIIGVCYIKRKGECHMHVFK